MKEDVNSERRYQEENEERPEDKGCPLPKCVSHVPPYLADTKAICPLFTWGLTRFLQRLLALKCVGLSSI